MKMSYRGKITF